MKFIMGNGLAIIVNTIEESIYEGLIKEAQTTKTNGYLNTKQLVLYIHHN
eukprot:m.326475 g.326475  ORF g.326475 m.326475 type:complete len:50 (+) comp16558_c1_seq14:3899-4048(+)